MSSWVQYFHNFRCTISTVTGNGVSSYITKYITITDPEYERSIFFIEFF